MRRIALLALAFAAACGAEDRVAGTAEVTILVTVPEGTPDVYLAGEPDVLGAWAPDGVLMDGEGRERRAGLVMPEGQEGAFKVTLGDWQQEAVDAEGAAYPNAAFTAEDGLVIRREVAGFRPPHSVLMDDVAGSGVLGTLVYWRDVESAHLDNPRHVSVWLPPGYEAGEGRYPVLYMSDGQNLFDPRIANTGTDWGIDEAMVAGAEAGAFEPAIVVASWSTKDRGYEYSPWHGAPRYARFVIEELKPRVDAAFRTRTGPEDTYHMGSSMGGLLSYHMVSEHPDVFSACGCVSTHFPLSPAVVSEYLGIPSGDDETPYILSDIAGGATVPPGTRYFFDYGTDTLDAEYGPSHAAVRDWLEGQGLEAGEDFVVRAYPGAAHDEASWRARVGDQLAWLLAGEAP